MTAESIWISPTKKQKQANKKPPKQSSGFFEFMLFAKELSNRVTV